MRQVHRGEAALGRFGSADPQLVQHRRDRPQPEGRAEAGRDNGQRERDRGDDPMPDAIALDSSAVEVPEGVRAAVNTSNHHGLQGEQSRLADVPEILAPVGRAVQPDIRLTIA